MRHSALVAGRVVLGGYLAAHGAQKLFGAFGGHGLEKTSAGFESIGLSPGRPMAALAGASELGGGLLTAAGLADPLGPVAIAGAMTVAVATHRKNGPLAANGGYELALTNLALATVLAAAGPGKVRLGLPLSKRLAAVVAVGAVAFTGVALVKLLTARPPAPAAAAPTAAPAPEASAPPASTEPTPAAAVSA
jgi:putative oxidoreductase